MITVNGRKRAVITHISPVIDGGAYPAKTVTGEELRFSADVFTDGHDELRVSLLLYLPSKKKPREYPMQFMHNDHWQLDLVTEAEGIYRFQIKACVDHFTTWANGLQKKYDAGQDVYTDLQIGAEMLAQAAENAATDDRAMMEQWISQLSKEDNVRGALALATGDEMAGMMQFYCNEELAVISGEYTVECERKRAGFSTWYELFPRSASQEQGRHGTFKDVKKLLPRIAEMGFDVLYFPPIHPIGQTKRKGRNNSLDAGFTDPGSPWAIGDKAGGHKAIHPELGTLKDFKDLVRSASQLGIEVALDIAFQCAPDHPYIKEHPQWFRWRPDGTVQYAENPPKKYEDILPFNFETDDWKNLWIELKSIVEYWIEQGVKVFRVDNPHTKPFAFWEWMIAKVRKKNPDVIFLAEAFTRPRLMERLAKAGFNQSYTYFSWRDTKADLEKYVKELTGTEMRYYFRPNFWPNTPDILPDHLVHGGENAHIIRLVLAATLSSNYGIYGPVYEFGINTPMPGKEEYMDNEKYEIRHWDWNAYTRLKEIITRVNRIRKENAALQSTWNLALAETQHEKIISYVKADKATSNVIIIVVNLDPFQTHHTYIRLPLDKMGIRPGQTFRVHDLLSGDRYNWEGEWQYIELRPYEMPAHIFKVELIHKQQ